MEATTGTKQGYKKTKLGWMPEEWNVLKLSTILESTRLGGNYANSESETERPLIKMGNIGRGNIVLEKVEYISSENSINDHDLLKKGDVLFNTRNTLDLVGKVAVWNEELPIAYYNSNLLKLQFKNEHVGSNFFMNYNLNSYKSIKQLRAIATGTTSVAAIYTRDLLKMQIPLPPRPEQQKIADILSTWDKAIEQTQKLIEQLKSRKKGLMQQLLSGKTRLKGFSGEWKKYQLGDLATNYNLINKDNKVQEVLSCTKYDGLVRSLEYFGRKVYGDDLSKYKVVPSGYFAYATNHIEEGSIGYQDVLDFGLVSPMYTVFKTNDKVDDSFFYKLLKTDKLIYYYQSNMSGSIARRGGLRWNVFETIVVKIPSIEEQQAIAKVLTTADIEIKTQETYLAQLQAQKKGLMQQLLTGQKRVNI